jgi:hypothetical protein
MELEFEQTKVTKEGANELILMETRVSSSSTSQGSHEWI